MIDLLNNWMLESTLNFNIIVGLTMVLYAVSLITLFYIGNKFGKPDERTNGIYFKIVSCMFTAHLILNGIFISLVNGDIEYFRQFFILFQGIVFMIGAIYAVQLYRKDFS